MTAANDPLYYAGDAAALDPAGCRLVTMLVVLGEWMFWWVGCWH